MCTTFVHNIPERCEMGNCGAGNKGVTAGLGLVRHKKEGRLGVRK